MSSQTVVPKKRLLKILLRKRWLVVFIAVLLWVWYARQPGHILGDQFYQSTTPRWQAEMLRLVPVGSSKDSLNQAQNMLEAKGFMCASAWGPYYSEGNNQVKTPKGATFLVCDQQKTSAKFWVIVFMIQNNRVSHVDGSVGIAGGFD